MASKVTKAVKERQAWELMFGFLMSSGARRSHSLAQRGLTPNDGRALWSLADDEGRPIGELAREWECDPANATFIIGRLTRFGYVRRRPSRTDGRVKLVCLTAAGSRVKKELMDEYLTPPDAFRALDDRDLEALIGALSKLAGNPSRDQRQAGSVTAET